MGVVKIDDWSKTPLGPQDKIYELRIKDEVFEISEESCNILLEHLKGISISPPIQAAPATPPPQSVRPLHLTATENDVEQLLLESQRRPPLTAPALSDAHARRKAQEALSELNKKQYSIYKSTKIAGVNVDYKGDNE